MSRLVSIRKIRRPHQWVPFRMIMAMIVAVGALSWVGGEVRATGVSFTNRTTANGLGSNSLRAVAVSGSSIYVATDGGLSISTDGGATFTNRTTANGLGAPFLRGVVTSGSFIYVATSGGLSISIEAEPEPEPDEARTPIVSLHHAILDPAGGTCVINGVSMMAASRTPFLGYTYIPGAEECRRDGHTFQGWATTNKPDAALPLPLLRSWGDWVWRYFIANTVDLVAVWKPTS